jgi:hypothetical protein
MSASPTTIKRGREFHAIRAGPACLGENNPDGSSLGELVEKDQTATSWQSVLWRAQKIKLRLKRVAQ